MRRPSRRNAGRESYGLELDVPAARDANGQLPMQVVGLADQVRAGLGNVVGRGSLETMGFQVREIVRLAVGLVTRCDDRRANAGRESYGLELDVPAARDANGQLPMQVVGLADQVRAGLGNVVGRGSLETMGFQVREIVRLAVGLVPRCDDRRANAGRESYGPRARCSRSARRKRATPNAGCRSGRSSPRRTWKRRRAWFPSRRWVSRYGRSSDSP